MRRAIVLFAGALSVLACGKDRPPEDVTTTRGAMAEPAPMVTVEQVRTVLLEQRPSASDTINALTITNDGGIITLRGRVEDEATHADIVNRVRQMPNVRGVRDELQVMPRSPMPEAGEPGTGGGPMGGAQVGGGPMGGAQTMGPTVDAVRQSMKTARPNEGAVIDALTITEEGQMVTVSGMAPDEATHQALIRAARDAAGGKTIRDEIRVEKKVR